MWREMTIAAFAATLGGACQQTGQRPDTSLVLNVEQPRYALGSGPRIVIDAAHNNFHTVDGRYAPFARLLRADGMRVRGSSARFSDQSLADVDILVIANAVADEDASEWVAPNPSALTAEEIAAVRRFVERGGGLLLIADHMPFGGAAQELGGAFGVAWDNGFAMDGDDAPDLFNRDNGGLVEDPLTADVRQVRTFTGSSFVTTQEHVRPLLRLGPQYQVLLPEVAWEFSEATPRLNGQGRLQGAVIQVGAGRVAVFAEAAMFTAQMAGDVRMGLGSAGAEDNQRFLLNVVHWLAEAGDSRDEL